MDILEPVASLDELFGLDKDAKKERRKNRPKLVRNRIEPKKPRAHLARKSPAPAPADYALDGKPIAMARKRGRPKLVTDLAIYPLERREEACAMYSVSGDIERVSRTCNIPVTQLRIWMQESWWSDIQRKIFIEQNNGLLGRINSVVDNTLSMLEDRVLNGDAIKIGEAVDAEGAVQVTYGRVPLKARDLAQIFHALTHQRNLMRGEATSIAGVSTSTEDRLTLLSKHFNALSQGIVLEADIIDESTKE